MANTMNARQIMKRTATASTIPTIPSSSDHTDGTWLATDIYKGEMFYNEANDSLWTRGTNGIVHLGGRAKLDITSAEVLALNSTPKAFGLTVPSGYYVQPLSIDFKSVYGKTPYATNISFRVRAVGAATHLAAQAINYSADIFARMAFSTATDIQYIDGVDLECYVATGNPTAGDSDITIYLTYVLIKI